MEISGKNTPSYKATGQKQQPSMASRLYEQAKQGLVDAKDKVASPFQTVGAVPVSVDSELFGQAIKRIESGDGEGCYSRPGLKRKVPVNRYMAKEHAFDDGEKVTRYSFHASVGDPEHPDKNSKWSLVRTDDEGNILQAYYKHGREQHIRQVYPLDLTKGRFVFYGLDRPVMTKEQFVEDVKGTVSDGWKKRDQPRIAENLGNKVVGLVLNDESLNCGKPPAPVKKKKTLQKSATAEKKGVQKKTPFQGASKLK